MRYSVTPQQIRIEGADGALLAAFSLAFSVGPQVYRIERLEPEAEGFLGLTEDTAVSVRIRTAEESLSVELCGPFLESDEIVYFRDSAITCGYGETFIPDDNNGTFLADGKKVFTLANSASAVKKLLGLTEALWMIAPQPHCLALSASPTGPALGLSIPECLPVEYVQFCFASGRFQLEFHHYSPANDGGRLPRVYLELNLSDRKAILDRHLGQARELGLVASAKLQPAWWHNPLYCTWGDQCCLNQAQMIRQGDSLTPERILGWAHKLRTFYSGEVNFIIDDGYFHGFGDYRIQEALYGSTEGFRSLMDQLKAMHVRPILWYTPIWVHEGSPLMAEHPEYFIQNRDGSLHRAEGDKGHYHLDWTHPGVREHNRKVIAFLLTTLDGDGFKIDMNFSQPLLHEVCVHDASWGYGNQLWKKIVEFIHQEATAIKPEAFITISGAESYLQPYAGAVRLNDLFNLHEPTTWYKRAELVSRLMPGVAIDTDGWPASLMKMREYSFVAPVFGAPVSYYLDGTEIGNVPLGETEINRMASVWATYDNARCAEGDRLTFDIDNDHFARHDGAGRLRALSLHRKILITYGPSIRVTADTAIAAAVPLDGRRVSRATEVRRDGQRREVPVFLTEGKALLHLEDAGTGILYYELKGTVQ